MKPVTREQWLEALRSGKYKQGKEVLCKNNKFCCLGVFCDLAEIPFKVKEDGIKHYIFSEDHVAASSYLYRGVLYYFQKNIYFNQVTLSVLNDEGRTFEEIADFVEGETKEVQV